MHLLEEANRETEKWKDECHYWKHKYHLLYRETRHILKSRLCENCRDQEDRELCPTCDQEWTKCT